MYTYKGHLIRFIACPAQEGVYYYMSFMYESMKISIYYYIPSNSWWISFENDAKAKTYRSEKLSNGIQAGKYIKCKLDKIKYWEQGSG